MNRQPIFFVILNFLIWYSNCTLCYAQEYSWKYYSVADGLPQTQIYCLYQDSRGVVWIGTKGGFSKFDGIEFDNYTSKDGLNFDFVTRFQEDGSGGMYIGTKLGANHFQNGEIEPIPIPETTGVSFYMKDKLGYMWLNEKRGELFCFKDGQRIKDHPVFSFLDEDELISNYHTTLDSNEISIVTNQGKIITWNGQEVKLVLDRQKFYRPLYSADHQLFGVGIDSLYQIVEKKVIPLLAMKNMMVRYINSKNDIYLADKNTASRLFHFDGNSIYEFDRRFNMIMDILIDDENNLWVGTESGLWRLQSFGFQNFLADPSNNYYTWTVLQDKEDNIWMGSYLYGIKKYDGSSIVDFPIMHMFKGNGTQVFYSGGVRGQNGNIYFGTAQGVLGLRNGEFEWLYQDVNNDAILYTYEDVKNNKFLAASARHGLIEFNENGDISFHHDRTSRQNTGLVTCVLIDKYDRIWISGKQGISIKEDENWFDLPNEKDSITFGAISMVKDNKENIWLGTNQGVYVYNYESVRRIGEEVFDEQIGVLNLTNSNELLIGSIKGIGLLDLNRFYENGDNTIRFFDSKNGFLGTECKHNSSFKDSHGNIWICTSDRVVKVKPSELQSNPNPPRVYIKNISILSENMEWFPVLNIGQEDKVYEIDSDIDDVRFYYHGISHAAPDGVKYQTMLEGYDQEWSGITSERYRTYTNLPNGTFTYKVKAANIDGVWTNNFASIQFEIKSAWHELFSVRIGGIIAVLLFAAGIGYLYSERIKKIKYNRDLNEKKITKLQFNSLRGLIDPHFTFNAINSIASMVYRENRDEAYHYFTKFSKLIRTAFDNSEQTTRSIKDELQFVRNYLDIEKMRFKDRFDYEIKAEKTINGDWKIPKMIIQIYTENAIKHGLIYKESGGFLSVVLSINNENLVIVVKDNGVGREQSNLVKDKSQSLGKGTKIMKDYFKLLNKFNDQKINSKTIDLLDDNMNSVGTEVVVEIPLSFKYTV